MTYRPRRALALLVMLLLVAAACDNGGDEGETDGDRTTTTADDAVDGDPTTTTAEAGDGAAPTSTSAPTTTAPPQGAATEGVIELVISGGDVEGGVRREEVKLGDQVTIRTTSDVADELHVHGYDESIDLVPGQSADLTFLADIPGVFEVELEQRGKMVLELEVRP